MGVQSVSRCPGHGRHWFTVHGHVGVRRPTCARCKAPNPRPLTADELELFEEIVGPSNTAARAAPTTLASTPKPRPHMKGKRACDE